MRVRLTVPKKHVDEGTLGKALDASAETAQREIEAGEVPPLADAIEAGQVKWQPEPARQGFESFDLPSTVMARGWGDCDDLAPWWAAELRATDVDPDAQPIVYQSGARRWHAVVQRGDGSIDDPSRWAGMGKPGGPLPTTPPMQDVDLMTVGFARSLRGARARIDVPLVGQAGVAFERHGDNAYDALFNTATGALAAGAIWGAPADVLARLHAIVHVLLGTPIEDLAVMHGCDVGDFGPFVCGLAEKVGAQGAKATFGVSPGGIADVAATIFDPLGIRNLVAPLAQTFVSSYASSLAQRHADTQAAQAGAPSPPPPTSRAAAPVSGDDYLERCPPGYHWERRGSLEICVPDVSGDDCPPGYHREVWGLTPVCVPDHVSGDDLPPCPPGYHREVWGLTPVCVPDGSAVHGEGRYAPWAFPHRPELRGRRGPPWTARGDGGAQWGKPPGVQGHEVGKAASRAARGGGRGGARGGGAPSRGARGGGGGAGRGGGGGGGGAQYGQGYDQSSYYGQPPDWSAWAQQAGYGQMPYYSPQQYSYPSGLTPFAAELPPSPFVMPSPDQYAPYAGVPGVDPYTGAPMMPYTGLTIDPYGGLSVPTAFEAYASQWAAEQPRSAFDQTIMDGQTTAERVHDESDGC